MKKKRECTNRSKKREQKKTEQIELEDSGVHSVHPTIHYI